MKPAPVVAKKEKNALAMKIAPVVVDVKTAMQKTLALVVVKMANAHAKKTVAK